MVLWEGGEMRLSAAHIHKAGEIQTYDLFVESHSRSLWGTATQKSHSAEPLQKHQTQILTSFFNCLIFMSQNVHLNVTLNVGSPLTVPVFLFESSPFFVVGGRTCHQHEGISSDFVHNVTPMSCPSVCTRSDVFHWLTGGGRKSHSSYSSTVNFVSVSTVI